MALKHNIDSMVTIYHMHHDKKIVRTLRSQAVTLQKVQELGSEATSLRIELVKEKQVATEAKALANTALKQMEQQDETLQQFQARDIANQQQLTRTKQAVTKLHQRLARSKRMVITLRADADATQKLLDLEMNNTKKMQADAEANRYLRDQEKLVWTATANANRKQLIEAKELVQKLRTTAEITQKEIQKEKRKVKQLRSDVVMVQEQLNREKQARVEAKTDAVMTHKRLEHEKETVTNLTHSLGHVQSELEVAVLMASDTNKLNSLQLQQASTDISRRIVQADAALRTEYSRAVDALEAASVVREKKLKSAHAQIEQTMENAHREEVAKLDNETRTVTRQLRRELAEVRAELLVDAQTTRANTATEKHENISMSEYKLGVQNSRQSSQQSLHHLAWRREQTLQQNQQQCSSYVGVDVPIAPDAVRDRCKGTSRSVSSQVSSYRFRTQESQWSKAKPIPITPVRGHSSRCSPTSIDTYAKEFAVNHVDPLSTPKHRQQRDERTQELLV